MSNTIKWIDLRDTAERAKLKVTSVNDDGQQRSLLFIIGTPVTSPRWDRAINELGFRPSANKKYLVRKVGDGEQITAKMFTPIWPRAIIAAMVREDVIIDFKPKRVLQDAQSSSLNESDATPAQSAEARTAQIETGAVVRLGRNAQGLEVFSSAMGRYTQSESGAKVFETENLRPEMFLHAGQSIESLDLCADGFAQALAFGDVQHSEDLDRFIGAIFDKEAPYTEAQYDQVAQAIESAMVRFLRRSFETAQDAYGESNRLYEYLPPYRGNSRGAGALPLPATVIAQRLFGDTQGKTVAIPHAWDGASFAFLAQDTQIQAFTDGKDLSHYARQIKDTASVTWGDSFQRSNTSNVDAIFYNADPVRDAQGLRTDYQGALNAMGRLAPGGRAVLALAGDDSINSGVITPESRRFLDALGRKYKLEFSVELASGLSANVGTRNTIRLISLRNDSSGVNGFTQLESFNVAHSWDDVKTLVDEAINSINLAEAQALSIDVDSATRENELQRPYLAFSKVGEARTMVPKNMQAPLSYALGELEREEGPVDDFVSRELGFGENTLVDRLSPEQVDAIGLSIARLKKGRGIIIGDETGIGKGRILSACATWAQKQNKPIIFVTDKANLFSDLMRDLRDLEEWGRFSPFIMNSDGVLVDVFTGDVIQEGTKPKRMKEILDNDVPLAELNANIIFTTYSQVATEDSVKGKWLLDQAANALVIVDESHIAAGSNSNTSEFVSELVNKAWGVVYSSATWAKSSENLHIYSRAFPSTINTGTLSATMKTGGEPFSEIFSAMLAKDGAFIRREHDLSKIEFVVEVDNKREERNAELSDRLSEILSGMSFVSGDVDRLLHRYNAETIAALKAAKEAARAAQNTFAANPANPANQGNAAAPDVLGAPVRPPPPQRIRGNILKSSFGAGSVLYQVMRRFLTILNTDNVIDLALKAVEENRKPVIVFEDTGEVFIRQLLQAETIPGINGEPDMVPDKITAPTIKTLLRNVMKRMGVISMVSVDSFDDMTPEQRLALENNGAPNPAAGDQAQEEAVDLEAVIEEQNTAIQSGSTMSVLQLAGLSEEQQDQYVKGMEKIMQMIDDLPDLPLSSIDVARMRFERAGLRVGEISGRNMRLSNPHTTTEDIGSAHFSTQKWDLIKVERSKQLITKTVFDFNNGDLDLLFINRSAATGLSLHASPRFQDQRRRELIEMQIPENPTDRVQLFGRVNRYDQVCTPKITLATTGIYGEMRHVMQQNKKIARLSANTRSSSKNAAEIKAVPDILNVVGNQVSKAFLLDNAGVRSRLGITLGDLESPGFAAASRLTSRIPMFKVAEQKLVYEEIYDLYFEAINAYELTGDNPLRSKEIDVRAKVDEVILLMGVEDMVGASAFDGPVYLKKISWEKDVHAPNWQAIREKISHVRHDMLEKGQLQESVYEVHEVNRASTAQRSRFIMDIERQMELEEMGFAPAEIDINGVEDAVLVPDANENNEELGVEGNLLGLPVEYAPSIPDLYASYSANNEEAVVQVAKDWYKDDAMQAVAMTEFAEKMSKIFDAKICMELVGTEFTDVPSALMAEKKNGIKTAFAKKLWIEQHFAKLVPGCMVGLGSKALGVQDMAMTYEYGIISGVKVPPQGREAMVSRWKFEVMVPGEELPRVIPLGTLLKDATVITNPVLGTGNDVYAAAPYSMILGDVYGPESSLNSQLQLRIERIHLDLTQHLRTGLRTERAVIMDGNMYLASEWAAATRAGSGVLYTDHAGMRQRAVMLKKSVYNRDTIQSLAASMPVRLWNSTMVGNFLNALSDRRYEDGSRMFPGDGRELNMHEFATSYKSAGAYHSDEARLVLVAGEGIAVRTAKSDAKRIARALRAHSKRWIDVHHPQFATYSTEEQKAVKAGILDITMSKNVVMVKCTSERINDAVKFISRAAGVELYIPRSSRYGSLAREIQTEYFRSLGGTQSAEELLNNADAQDVREEPERLTA